MLSVYALYNKERNKIYIGQTDDLEKRILRHNHLFPTKSTSYTSKLSGTWILVYDEPASDRSAARLREKQLKTARGRMFIWSIIENTHP